jgi:hypothetical protein
MDSCQGRSGVLSIAGAVLLTVSCDKAPASQAAPSGKSDSAVAARVGDREISLDQVDVKAFQMTMRSPNELYEARRQALEELIAESLVEQEAKARGVTREELIAQEIDAKLPQVTEQDIQGFFDQNRDRLGGQTLEQIGGQIREFLASRNQAAARQKFVGELRAKATVDVSLDPPRVEIAVAQNERSKGPGGAPVTIVEYSDFQ